ncbi:diguanylate cyclase [Gilvimarinus agarilyticus]|uniref:GGDEF domain-containing protein n=1 Tax=unclassified Gilvimarinus TaxID=2642066 RepID=UPI001C09EC9E|nr:MULTISPECIES: diguanylate cyclase [unclassified Gilvimarinus]MBU2887845.1 diguanylate cyclase [Gilvimarinus agarilyticus]MDO6572483.1 diguanylate cyclase [Gilvimarinus sp. 2_MG-2023]MDO6746623.1 diguanylate cyclase [Gilvimarinus sp. 1_MG-2023]
MITTLRNNFRQAMMLLLSACAIIAITPLAMMRALAGQWLLAGLDAVIVLGMLLVLRYNLRHQHSLAARLSSASFYSIAGITMVYFKLDVMVYWLFPVVIANFFLLSLRQAIVINCAVLLVIAPAVSGFTNPSEPIDFYVALILVCAFAGIFSWKTEDQRQQLEQLAHHDPLTGMGNRRKLFSKLGPNNAKYTGSMVLMDLDHFKAINDELGHERGDTILQQISALMTNKLRQSDELYRYGGEEFLVVLNNTGLSNACRIAELLRREINEQLSITASFGCAQKHPDEDWDSWIARADKALYQAKNEGRNCVRPAPTNTDCESADALP